MCRTGHSLVELTVVMVIVGILAVAMMIKMKSQSWHKLNAAAERMASDIRYARQLAVSSGKWIKVVFDPATSANYYRIRWVASGSATENLLQNPLEPTLNFDVDFDDTGSPHQGVTFANPANCAGTTNDPVFNVFGEPTCCTDATHSSCPKIAGSFSVILSYAGNNRTVSLNPQTGMVTVQ